MESALIPCASNVLFCLLKTCFKGWYILLFILQISHSLFVNILKNLETDLWVEGECTLMNCMGTIHLTSL